MSYYFQTNPYRDLGCFEQLHHITSYGHLGVELPAYKETAAPEKEVKSEEAPKVPKEAEKPVVHPCAVVWC